jgi:hypothetical protein
LTNAILISRCEFLGLASFVIVIVAPIKSVDKSLALGEQQLWYDVDALNLHLNTIQGIDVVLVDGPFAGLTPNARFSAIPYLQNKLAKTYAIFLDDIDRDDEKAIIGKWVDILQCSKQKVERYAILSPETKFFSRPFQL